MAQWKLVVAGVDGSEESKRALQVASEQASEHGAELLVVSAWTPPPPSTAPPFGSFPWGPTPPNWPRTQRPCCRRC
jgi:Universal stress protein family